MENRLSAVESRAYLLEVACAFLVFKIHRVPGRGKSRLFHVSKHRFKR